MRDFRILFDLHVNKHLHHHLLFLESRLVLVKRGHIPKTDSIFLLIALQEGPDLLSGYIGALVHILGLIHHFILLPPRVLLGLFFHHLRGESFDLELVRLLLLFQSLKLILHPFTPLRSFCSCILK